MHCVEGGRKPFSLTALLEVQCTYQTYAEVSTSILVLRGLLHLYANQREGENAVTEEEEVEPEPEPEEEGEKKRES